MTKTITNYEIVVNSENAFLYVTFSDGSSGRIKIQKCGITRPQSSVWDSMDEYSRDGLAAIYFYKNYDRITEELACRILKESL